jgi:hypothetical protein
MLKRFLNAAVIALALCMATGFGAGVWRASNIPHPSINHNATAQKESQPNPEAPKESTEEAIARYNKWLTVFTGILAIATTGLGIATVGLYFAGERQLKLTERSANSAIALQRPRLFIGHTHILQDVDPMTGNQTVFCNYDIENYGQSPAILDSFCVDVRILAALPERPNYLHIVGSRRVIYRGEPMDGLRASLPQTEQHLVGQLGAGGGLNLYVIGFFEYRDVFDATITTGFCYQTDWTVGRLRRVGRETYNYDHRDGS